MLSIINNIAGYAAQDKNGVRLLLIGINTILLSLLLPPKKNVSYRFELPIKIFKNDSGLVQKDPFIYTQQHHKTSNKMWWCWRGSLRLPPHDAAA